MLFEIMRYVLTLCVGSGSKDCCIVVLCSLRPLFPGSNELDQIHKIHDIVGTPSPAVLDKFRKV